MYTILMTAVLALAPTNMELAEDALALALQELPAQLTAYGVESVSVEMVGEHAGNWLISQTVMSFLHEEGFQVIDRGEPDSTGMVLRVRPMELRVEYGKVSRPWLVGNKRVERIAKCELSSTLIAGSGEIVMSVRTSGIESDVISWSDAQVLNGSTDWEWLSGDLPENRGGGILEPIVVTGVVASLVYLFYSSRAE